MGTILTQRFDDALVYASRLHAQQQRKGCSTPYISHLLAVTALVLEEGGDEDQAIAALLHDAVEDQGGMARLEEINRLFGERVAFIVRGCTDAFTSPKPPWQERKIDYLAHLWAAPPEILLVSLADKVHNARSILRDLEVVGDELWGRFRGGRDGTMWYYRSLIKIFQANSTSPLVTELCRVVQEIEAKIED